MAFSWIFRVAGKVRARRRVERSMTPRRFALVLLAYLSFLALVDLSAYLGLIPAGVREIPLYDTFGHFGLLGLAGLLLHRTLGRRAVRVRGLPLPLGPLLVAGGAAVEELLQVFSPVRSACLSDFAADVAGIALFSGLDAVWHRWARRPARA